MSVLNNSGYTSSTPAAYFLGFVLFNASLTSCNCHLPRSFSSISSYSTILSSSPGFVGSSLFNISLKCSTHLCSLSHVSVLSTPCLSLTPISWYCCCLPLAFKSLICTTIISILLLQLVIEFILFLINCWCICLHVPPSVFCTLSRILL